MTWLAGVLKVGPSPDPVAVQEPIVPHYLPAGYGAAVIARFDGSLDLVPLNTIRLLTFTSCSTWVAAMSEASEHLKPKRP